MSIKCVALALFSGGLDSSLAIRLLQQQDIKIIGLHFLTPFSVNVYEVCLRMANKMEFKLINLPIGADFFKIVENPAYGYGKKMNPCIDCKIMMLKKAKQLLNESKASFIVTGDVVGQRPMSQNKKTLKIIEKAAGLEGLIVRPLSARLLQASIPEEEGLVVREKLLNISGRSRKIQLKMAEDFNVNEYFTPAGGCLLTDPAFSRRLKDLLANGSLSLEEVSLLKLGRHFRIAENAKLIVGRDQVENGKLLEYFKSGDVLLEPQLTTGPISILKGKIDDSSLFLAAAIVARYCGNTPNKVTLTCTKFPSRSTQLETSALDDEEINKFRL